ncbi:MAG TPA: glycine--tRNA ligase subunit beta, partial [Gaiellales bacterium]
MPDLLVEVGCEELPAAHCRIAEAALPGLVAAELERAGIAAASVVAHVAPRRLAAIARGIPERREAQRQEVRGPRADAPEQARQGFARKHGLAVEALVEREGFVWAVSEGATVPASELVPDAVAAAVARLQFPRTMRWPGGRFSRPIRWLVCKLDGEVVPATVAGVVASSDSRGPRPGRDRVPISSAGTYLDDLRAHGVLVAAAERRSVVLAAVEEHGAVDPMGKVEEVVYLVERPRVLVGEFPAGYLDLPERIPVTAMQSHQRYFPIRSGDGALEPRFLVVANGGVDDVVRRGNEEVLVGRLDDARFAYDRDRGVGLAAMVGELDRVSFLEGGGSLADKTARLGPVIEALCEENGLGDDARRAARRAAELCKADLVSRLVGEFSALQGYAGSVYAREAGEPDDVCTAIDEHYRPDEAGGDLPATAAGALVALADKGDTIRVAFAAGLEPTGSRDPYGLRRAAAGLVAIALGRGWNVDLPALVGERAVGFVLDRLEPVLIEEGVTIEELRAARGSGETEPAAVAARARDLHAFAGPRRDAVRDAYGRCARIAGETAGGPVDEDLLEDPAERALAEVLLAGGIGTLDAAAETLAPAVERFFDEVLVMSEDEALRRNRLTLVA